MFGIVNLQNIYGSLIWRVPYRQEVFILWVMRIHRLKRLIRWKLLLFILFLNIVLYCYNSLRPWCERLRDEYPVEADLESFRLGESQNVWLLGIRPINKVNYEYVHTPMEACHRKEIEILSLVKSKPDNYRLREAIRKTWGIEASHGRNKLVFSLGKTGISSLQKKIDEEVELYQDIIQGNFEDTYLNLTLKTMNGIYWISKFCPKSRYVIMADEDVIINFKNLQNFFSEVPGHQMNSLFTGFVVATPTPTRVKHKFDVSLEDYPFPCYPPYVSGPTILTTGIVIKMLNTAIPYVKRFMFEDVYLGIVVLKLGIKLSTTHNEIFDYNGLKIDNLACILSSHQGGDITGERYEDLYFSNIQALHVC